jgi:transcriptional regulator with XRE-family HTH domain
VGTLDKDLSEYLRAHRDRVGLTQQQLARMIGVSQETIQQYEQGRAIPSPRNLVALAAVLRLPPDELLATSGFFSARAPKSQGHYMTESIDHGRESSSSASQQLDPVRRAAEDLFAMLQERVAPDLRLKAVNELWHLASMADPYPHGQETEQMDEPATNYPNRKDAAGEPKGSLRPET